MNSDVSGESPFVDLTIHFYPFSTISLSSALYCSLKHTNDSKLLCMYYKSTINPVNVRTYTSNKERAFSTSTYIWHEQ